MELLFGHLVDFFHIHWAWNWYPKCEPHVKKSCKRNQFVLLNIFSFFKFECKIMQNGVFHVKTIIATWIILIWIFKLSHLSLSLICVLCKNYFLKWWCPFPLFLNPNHEWAQFCVQYILKVKNIYCKNNPWKWGTKHNWFPTRDWNMFYSLKKLALHLGINPLLSWYFQGFICIYEITKIST